MKLFRKIDTMIYKSIGVIIVKKTLAIYLDLLRSIQKKRDQLQRLSVLNVVIHSLSYSVEVFNMEYRGLDFEEQEFHDCLNILHKEIVSFLNENNMAMDFFQYPVEDICRIIFRDKIDLRTAVILDFGITTYDLSPLGDHDPFVWRLLEWPLYDYENFQFVIVQKLASYELDKLNEIIQVEDNKDNKDKRRL